MMTKPTNSENPGLFWFYRLVGFGAIFAAVRLNRNGSGWLGTIPPAPDIYHEDGPTGDYVKWAKKTFTPGTPVRVVEDGLRLKGFCYDEKGVETPGKKIVPYGTKMKVSSFDDETLYFVLEHEDVEPMFTSVVRKVCKYSIYVTDADENLEPLVDNWGPLVISSSGGSPVPQQGWARQLKASRLSKARRRP